MVHLDLYINRSLPYTILELLYTLVITLSLLTVMEKTFYCNDEKITECDISDTCNYSTTYILM